MNKINIAIIAGGYSGEYSVSLRSAQGILSWIDRELFTPYLVRIEPDGWWVDLPDGSVAVRKDCFGFEYAGIEVCFAYAYITIHGTPGENGLMQGYLDMLGVPYNTGGVLCEALTFNKYFCNRYLGSFDSIRVARSARLKQGLSQPSVSELIHELGLPLFVKPNMGGSSVATSRVDNSDEIQKAIDLAMEESSEVLVEQFIPGMEVTCGCLVLGGELRALPITEVITRNAFFDYNAKYHGEVEEITPARISEALTVEIQALTRAIYDYIDAEGIIRVDYIIEPDGRPTLLEVNTTPGMTPTSFIPQQVRAAGLEMRDILTEIIQTKIK
ncbi:MAG: D-alanine--D-alanine ligase [Porphyromonadaceae bacterium]|nr:D-alanine--D-alanine ligase [Porphyromonadaceae bacterium]